MSENLRTNLDNAHIFFRWISAMHPEVLDEYFHSRTYKALTKMNKRLSTEEALKIIEEEEVYYEAEYIDNGKETLK